MIDGKSVLAVITARGGSKGVPRKNIRSVAGKPLIAWTIEEAKKSRYVDRLILSSEDMDIVKVAALWGCETPFLRPKELARDDTPGVEPILHVLDNLPDEYDYVVLLQPTSPLRQVDDIDGCIKRMREYSAPSCVTVTEVDKSPYWMYEINNASLLIPFLIGREKPLRRQDMPSIYALNGAVYAGESLRVKKMKTFLAPETVAYVMPRERSLDIDTELDMKICEFLLSAKGSEQLAHEIGEEE